MSTSLLYHAFGLRGYQYVRLVTQERCKAGRDIHSDIDQT